MQMEPDVILYRNKQIKCIQFNLDHTTEIFIFIIFTILLVICVVHNLQMLHIDGAE